MPGVAAQRRISRGIDDSDTVPTRLNSQYLRYVDGIGSLYYIIGANTVFSIWFKRATAGAGGALISRWQGSAVNNSSFGQIPPCWFHLYVGSTNTGGGTGITDSQFRLSSYNEGGGAGNSSIGFTWDDVPTDTEWHHALVHVKTWSGAFPGNFSAELYIDGASRGTKSATGPGTYNHTQVLFKTLGIGRSAILNTSSDLGFQGTPALLPLSESSYPTGYTSNISDYWSACVNQVWIGTVNTFRIADFYGGGIVDLGADGQSGGTQILPAPGFYNRLNYPTDLQIVENNAIVSETTANQCT
jgi:hypothetical protein